MFLRCGSQLFGLLRSARPRSLSRAVHQMIDKLEFTQPFVIGVAGGSGSGKTCVANLIRQRCLDTGVAVLNQDSYYIDRSAIRQDERSSLNYDHPSAFDHDLL